MSHREQSECKMTPAAPSTENTNCDLCFIYRFDVDVPGGAVYKESSFTEAGKKHNITS